MKWRQHRSRSRERPRARSKIRPLKTRRDDRDEESEEENNGVKQKIRLEGITTITGSEEQLWKCTALDCVCVCQYLNTDMRLVTSWCPNNAF